MPLSTSLAADIPRLARYAARLARRPDEVVIGGVRLAVPPGARGPVLHSIYAEKYEGLEIAALPRYLRPGDRIVEAGAAIGFVGLCCARIVGGDNLLMIEANPALLPIINGNFARNDLPAPRLLNAVAATDDDGSVAFHVAEQFWSSSVLDRGQTAETTHIDKVDLNRVFREEDADVFICDIEGGEFALLPSLDLSRVRLVVIELHRKLADAGAVESAIAQIEAQGLPLKETLKDEVFIFQHPE
ncbi:MAG: FkbM family methyltransferase [Pseudomonadota bacterium]